MMVPPYFVLPRPDAFDELLAADVAPVGSCRSISWRSTTICVAMPAWSVPGCHSTSRPRMRSKRHEDVLQRVVERVPHVQRARHVRRRDDDRSTVRLAARSGASGLEGARPFPFSIDARLDLGGLIRLFEHQRGADQPGVVRPRVVSADLPRLSTCGPQPSGLMRL